MRKPGPKHDVQPQAGSSLDGTQTTQESRNGGSGSRWVVGKGGRRRRKRRRRRKEKKRKQMKRGGSEERIYWSEKRNGDDLQREAVLVG